MIPERKGDRWYEKKAVIEALATVPPVLAAAIGALVSLSERQKRAFGWWLLAGAVWLMGASVAKVLHARAQDRERKRSDEHDGLRAALHVLFATLCRTAGIAEEERTSGRLRLTVHRVVTKGKSDPPEELEQLLPYMGGTGNPPGRRFSIRSGIIGMAARRRESIVAVRGCAEHEGFIAELMRKWAYPEHDARTLTPDRHTWMAVPDPERPRRNSGRGLPGFSRSAVLYPVGPGDRSRHLWRHQRLYPGGLPMNHEKDELWYGSTRLGEWKVISRPGAIIQAKVLEMSDEVWRDLTTTDPNFPPPKHKHSW